MVARDLLGLHPLTGETPATTLVQPFLSVVSSPEPNHVVVVQPRIPHDVRQQHPVVETGVLFAQRPGQLFGRAVDRKSAVQGGGPRSGAAGAWDRTPQ